MKLNPAIWFEIYVQDIERAKKFYEAVLQIKLEKLDTPATPELSLYAFPMDKDGVGAGGALVKMDGFPSGGNSCIVYFASGDCSIEAGRVVAAGGRIHREKFSIAPYGFIALGYDTEGNMFGIHSME